ncbi:MAG: DUF11 domain-containing protein [Chloroflexi bacterium]|nr:DUF11 domain-containing protein [Chloroflexota bacterium]
MCDVGDIPAGGEVRVSVNGIADPGAPGEGSYRVQAMARESDPTPRNNRGARVVTIAPAPEIVVTAKAVPERAAVGEEITYTFTVTNNGPGAVTDRTLRQHTDLDGLRIVRPDPRCADGPGETQVRPRECPLGDLAAGQSVVVTQVAVAPMPGRHEYTVTALAHEPGSHRARQNASSIVTVDPTIDLAVTVNGPPGPVQAGDELRFSVTVENRSDTAVEGVEITVPLAPGTEVSRSMWGSERRDCGMHGETEVGCSVQRLEAGTSKTVALAIVAGPAGQMDLSASVQARASLSTPPGDPDLSNNVSPTIAATIIPRDCGSRPLPVVRVDPGAPNRLRVQVEAATNSNAPENRLGRLRFGALEGTTVPPTNALLDFPERLGRQRPGNCRPHGRLRCRDWPRHALDVLPPPRPAWTGRHPPADHR